MKEWRDCQKDPPETGKKVLCHRLGDIYVAKRFGKYYIPFPFCDSQFALDLSSPETWCEIDFPEGLTGHLRILIDGNLITASEAEVDYPDYFQELSSSLINALGKRFDGATNP